MYKFNHNFFKCIDSEEKAYVLGFFFADGYNSDTQIEFTQLEQDEDILIQINKALESEVPIYSYINKINGNTKKALRFSSREMCEDMNRLGGIRGKSLILEFPKYLSKELIPHFIRGYFDGDGCVWDGKRKKMVVKDPKCKNGYRERIVHNVKVTFTGCKLLINSLQDILVNELGFKKTKLNLSKAKDKQECAWCTMEYSGRGQLKKLFDFMYKDATIYGSRKYNKFNEIFCALDERSSIETVLTEETAEMLIVNQASQEEGSSTIPEMGVESSDSKCTAPNE